MQDDPLSAAVSDLRASSGSDDGYVNLKWTAPGDDGSTGTAASYDIRYSTSTIDDGNWASATQVAGEPTPAPKPPQRKSETAGAVVKVLKGLRDLRVFKENQEQVS